MSEVKVNVRQISPTTSQATIRDKHRVLIDRPIPKEGTDEGAMGGELLLAALGGCFMSNLLAAIRTREAEISNVSITIEGTLEANPSHFSAIQLQISADYSDRELFEKLVLMSERACIVANTIRSAVKLDFVIIS